MVMPKKTLIKTDPTKLFLICFDFLKSNSMERLHILIAGFVKFPSWNWRNTKTRKKETELENPSRKNCLLSYQHVDKDKDILINMLASLIMVRSRLTNPYINKRALQAAFFDFLINLVLIDWKDFDCVCK